MTQYLIETITHDTGEVFIDVIKPRKNESFELIEVDSLEELEDYLKHIESKGDQRLNEDN